MRFETALRQPGLSAIAEVKRRSPSSGDLRPDADPARLAAQFARAGAAAVSVLVDERFGGTIDDLRAARDATDAPLLGKGFFSTEEHLDELRDAGADAVLLLLRDLDDATTARLLTYAAQLGMDALVEAHDAEELERAMALEAPIVGVNARDLSTFRIDRKRQLALVAQAAGLPAAPRGRAGFARTPALQLPGGRIVIAESGVQTRAQGAAAELAGADAVLVGSALMRAADPPAKLRELLSRPLVKVCGLTRQEDVDVAVEAGADLLGFILAEKSPRRADAVLDVPPTALSVAVFVGETHAAGADLVQLYPDDAGTVRGREAVLLREGVEVARVLDQPWGGRDPIHWSTAAAAEGRIMLAGGLGPENVREAIAAVRPWAVDASSSLESEPGIKDHARVRAYIEAANLEAANR
jgi:indole-3-glycerol phosphate synthase / phosphoribosylanthranilate isomerase